MINKIASLLLIAILSSSTILAETNDLKAKPAAIRVAPPSPRFSDAERQAELAARRSRVIEKMADNSLMVLFSAEARIYTNDVDFMYRQENNLYYLTGLKQTGATLVLAKSGGAASEFLFIPKRNPQFETWNGRMYSNEDATRISGLKTIVNAAEQKAYLAALKDKTSFTSKDGVGVPTTFDKLYLLLPFDERDGDGKREFRQETEFAGSFGPKAVNAQDIFAELRLIKSPYEIRLMQHAIDITAEAHMRSMGIVKRANWEYEVQAEVEYTFRRRNADYWGYPSIVGCGPNATTLHYVESQGAIDPNALLLMDVGAEYDHYTADVTRTFPVNGKFSKPQAEIYQVVYDAQEAAAAELKPGALFSAAGQSAAKTIEEGLAKLGLIEKVGAVIPGTLQKVPDGKGGTREVGIPQYRIWYMHGLGHWLGMNVHDVGDYETPLKPGMIMTNEPGIYIREDALDYFDQSKPGMKEFLAKIRPSFERYKSIGVRIEDDMLITETGVEWMTRALPRKISDIEESMARAAKEMRNVALTSSPLNPTLAVYGSESGLVDWNSRPTGRTIRIGWNAPAHDHSDDHRTAE
ncbi:MAG: aminopeptidase P family protein [Acidobacteria bacterium]|nr:aminopeptidase P family protein [Acidobacteriota bacterium]